MPRLEGSDFAGGRRRVWLGLPAGLLLLGLVACGDGQTRTQERPVEDLKAVFDVAPEDRFGLRIQENGFSYVMPAGWQRLRSSSMRYVNLRPLGQEGMECYLTILGGDGGGLMANVNRWRQQFGQEPLDEAGIAGLPTLPLCGFPATLVECQGSFQSMGGQIQDSAALIGLIVVGPQGALFLKMTGPAEGVGAARRGFVKLAESLRFELGDAAPSGAQQSASTQRPPQQTSGAAGVPVAHEAPEGWVAQPPSSLRNIHYRTPGGTACYVTLLDAGSQGGGIAGNVNRWYRQMGQDPLGAEAMAALPTVASLGTEGVVVDLAGPFTGMGGNRIESARMLAAFVPHNRFPLSVKMVGEAADVAAERSAFLKFVGSLKVAEGR